MDCFDCSCLWGPFEPWRGFRPWSTPCRCEPGPWARHLSGGPLGQLAINPAEKLTANWIEASLSSALFLGNKFSSYPQRPIAPFADSQQTATDKQLGTTQTPDGHYTYLARDRFLSSGLEDQSVANPNEMFGRPQIIIVIWGGPG